VSTRAVPSASAPTPLDRGRTRRQSYARLAITDGMAALGVVTALCGLAGIFDDRGDALFLLVVGSVAVGVGVAGRRTLERRHRPAPGRILSGLALAWLILVVVGTGVYLGTGTIGRVDDAFVEAAAGFSTTNVTILDPGDLSVSMQLWRAATQWVGGFFGILVAVIALPLALRGRVLAKGESLHTDDRLAPTPAVGRRRVLSIYSALTLAIAAGYLLTGLGVRDSAVHALTTISTGGFSSQTDSFVGFGNGPRVVAVIGMMIAGSSYFVVWWAVRGRLRPVWSSTELRMYAGLLAAGSALVAIGGDGIGFGDAIFTSVSAISTTGYAVGDWTVLDDSVLMVLLILIGTGSMSGGAGGGLHVVRAWALLGFALRELRRQLDPASVVVIKQGGRAIDERVLERTTGYQIAHLGLCGLAAFLLAAAGVDVIGAIYTGISVLSTNGTGVGAGPFGDITGFSPIARLLLVPFMLAGRLTILPLLLGLAWLFRARSGLARRARRLLRRRR
jgi:trk/ktr system potassium uptake protein